MNNSCDSVITEQVLRYLKPRDLFTNQIEKYIKSKYDEKYINSTNDENEKNLKNDENEELTEPDEGKKDDLPFPRFVENIQEMIFDKKLKICLKISPKVGNFKRFAESVKLNAHQHALRIDVSRGVYYGSFMVPFTKAAVDPRKGTSASWNASSLTVSCPID
eukprot:GHVL01007838.1.p5 GENE.GHVL01007838.1~~GHVL01007838.1.p5  ORF type:complete len:162 (-),score=31.95 GHVL01007838.1:2434-2919(-)